MTKIKRETLIDLCNRGVVPVKDWANRDTPEAQAQLAKAGAYLKAGCKFSENKQTRGGDNTIWVDIIYPSFGTFDWGAPEDKETFYIPSEKRLLVADGRDWY